MILFHPVFGFDLTYRTSDFGFVNSIHIINLNISAPCIVGKLNRPGIILIKRTSVFTFCDVVDIRPTEVRQYQIKR